MTTPKYKDFIFTDYEITRDGRITNLLTNKLISSVKKATFRTDPEHRIGVEMQYVMGYTFFDGFDQKLHTFEYLNGDNTDFRVDNMKLVSKSNLSNFMIDENTKVPIYKNYNFEEYRITREGLITRLHKNGKIHNSPFQEKPSLFCSSTKVRPRICINELLKSTFHCDPAFIKQQNPRKGTPVVKRDSDYTILDEYHSTFADSIL